MKNIYYISDTHFDEDRIFDPTNLFYRPFEQYCKNTAKSKDEIIKYQNEYIAKVINSYLPDDAVLYHLGDVSKTSNGLRYMDEINCAEKHLILGNYDQPFVGTGLLEEHFDSIQEDLLLKAGEYIYYLNHYPSKGTSEYRNIVGHIHSLWKVQPNMVNVGVDVWNFLPVSHTQIEFCFDAITNFYDKDVFPCVDPSYKSYLKHSDFNSVDVLYSNQSVDFEVDIPSIFLAGPTPRNSNISSWRPEMIKELRKHGFEGRIYVPEPSPGSDWPSFEDQVDWEEEALVSSTIILFWIPRDLQSIGTMPDGSPKLSLPGFTTNIEFGQWLHYTYTVYGRPDDSPKIRVLDHKFNKLTHIHNFDRKIQNSIEETAKEAVRQFKKIENI